MSNSVPYSNKQRAEAKDTQDLILYILHNTFIALNVLINFQMKMRNRNNAIQF